MMLGVGANGPTIHYAMDPILKLGPPIQGPLSPDPGLHFVGDPLPPPQLLLGQPQQGTLTSGTIDPGTLTSDPGSTVAQLPPAPGNTPQNPLDCGLYNCGPLGGVATAGPDTTKAPTDYTTMILIGVAGLAAVILLTSPGGRHR